MTRYRFFALLIVLLAGAALAAGCGTERRAVGADEVAVVGDKTITKDQFDHFLEQVCRSYRTQGNKCPEAGTKPYGDLRRQAMQYLVQRAEFEQRAADLGVKVGDDDVERELTKIKAQYWGKNGKCDAKCEEKYRKEIKRQGATDEQVHSDVRANVVQNRLYEEVTKDVQVTDADVAKYYKDNKEQYVQPATREVRHILVKKKGLANQIYQQLTGGGSFAKLAKKYSEDPSSKAQGGKLTVSKGRQVPEFDKSAFSLNTKEISKPIKTQYGWHIIQALGPITKERTTPLKEVSAAIRQQLVQTKKQEKMQAWVKDTQKDFEPKTNYQVGYAPPATTSATTTSK
jgi:parvulin-like peptidyl-prolyl isomerase